MDQKNNQLTELLLLALKAEGAEMGTIRNYESVNDELVIISHHGFSQEYLTHYHSVKPFDSSSCGRCFGIGSIVVIPDIEHDLSYKKQAKTLKLLSTEFRAVKSVAILTQKGKKVGVLSVNFKQPKWDWSFNADDKILSKIADLLSHTAIKVE